MRRQRKADARLSTVPPWVNVEALKHGKVLGFYACA